eukprot:1330467-Prymnesium_polylepis.1
MSVVTPATHPRPESEPDALGCLECRNGGVRNITRCQISAAALLSGGAARPPTPNCTNPHSRQRRSLDSL